MPKTTSKPLNFDNREYARIIRDNTLLLLGRDLKSGSAEVSAKLKPVIDFAKAVKANRNISSLEKLFNQIENPGFNIAYQFMIHLIAGSSLAAKQNQSRVKEILNQYDFETLTAPQKLNYAVLTAKLGNIDKAEQIVEQVYQENSRVKDGYTRIGWQYYLPKKDYSAINVWLQKDKDAKRLSANALIKEAQVTALIEGMEKALPLVEEAYNKNPQLQNVYSQVAWTRYVQKNKAYDKTLKFFDLDKSRGKLNNIWQLNYAQALVACGNFDEAQRNVEEAYKYNPYLSSGYARCGYVGHFIVRFQPAEAVQWFEQDINLKKLDAINLVQYASVLAVTGKLDQALKAVERAYKDSRSRNGYSLVGWYYYAILNRLPKKALELFAQDKKLGRQLPNAGNLNAALYAYLGDRKQAEQMVKENYARDINIVGGNSIIGLADYSRNRDISYVKTMMEKDQELRRLARPPFYEYIYAGILLKLNSLPEAQTYAQRAYRNSVLTPEIADSWIKRICLAKDVSDSQFLIRELQKPNQLHS
jgi:phosphorylcholine metabolism protein LicD